MLKLRRQSFCPDFATRKSIPKKAIKAFAFLKSPRWKAAIKRAPVKKPIPSTFRQRFNWPSKPASFRWSLIVFSTSTSSCCMDFTCSAKAVFSNGSFAQLCTKPTRAWTNAARRRKRLNSWRYSGVGGVQGRSSSASFFKYRASNLASSASVLARTLTPFR
ncbi:hypothetical protein D3C86_1758330 [compost metagenome]